MTNRRSNLGKVFRVDLFGDSNVGKTTLFDQFANEFDNKSTFTDKLKAFEN
jgi:GTPase SAR1 family protein